MRREHLGQGFRTNSESRGPSRNAGCRGMHPGGEASQQRIRGWAEFECEWTSKENSRTANVEAATDGGATTTKRSSNDGADAGAGATENR